jgi:hypothetical protein
MSPSLVKTNQSIQCRIFLVGCPRSGTTLLQSRIAAHPNINSFPESHFFQVLNNTQPWRKLLGLASSQAQLKFQNFLSQIDPEHDYSHNVSAYSEQLAKSFVDRLDQITLREHKTIWLEKTPQHALCIDQIEKYVENAFFIHLVRSGEDVVASLYDAALKYPTIAWQNLTDIDKCINMWIRYKRKTSQHLSNPNHILIEYESFVEDPRTNLINICQFIGIDFCESMLNSYGDSVRKVVNTNESWKSNVGKPIENANRTKFSKIFSCEQQEYIRERISSNQIHPELSIRMKSKIRSILSHGVR